MKSLIATCILLLMAIAPLPAQMVSAHAAAASVKQPDVSAAPQPAGRPVARVNGSVLTDRDLLREMYAIFPYARQHNGGFPKEMEANIRAGALQMLVFEELVYQEAERRKMTVPAAKLEKALAEFRKQFKSPDDYKNFMQTECNGSQQVLRAKIQRSLLIDALLKQEVEGKSTVSLVQAKAYFEKNPDKFRVPESFAFQTISVLVPDKATPAQLKEAHQKAEDAFQQAKATKSYEEFGVLAEKISEDDYRVMMGDHKAVDRSKLPPEVIKAALAMQPGQVSELFKFGENYCIFRLNAHIPAGTMKFEDVKAALIKNLQQQKSEQLRGALDKKLKANAKVEQL